MINKYKWKLLISSLIIILPTFLWSIFGEKLTSAVYFGEADGIKQILTIMPLIFLAVHWGGFVLTYIDNQKRGQSPKVFNMIFWILPSITVFVNVITVLIYSNIDIEPHYIMVAVFSIMFIVIGNYMPKCKRNRTIGLKLKWTLANEDNWNKTHRFCGFIWVVCGILLIPLVLLPEEICIIAVLGIVAVAVVVPTLYSYLYYRKQVKSGLAVQDDPIVSVPKSKTASIVSSVLVTGIIIFAVVICFTGNIEPTLESDALVVKASFYSDLTLKYEDIDTVEYVENCDAGHRVAGFGTPRLLMGLFKNKELGEYTRFSYAKEKTCVVLTVDGKIFVVGCSVQSETKALYEGLLEKCGK